MKNIVVLLAVIVLSACGQAEAPPSTRQAPAPTEQMKETPPVEASYPAVGETIATYQTPIVDKKEARLHNIDLAMEAVSGAAIPPGEEFSFNETVGARTPQRGYQKAIIFNHGEMEKGYGGGICQVSSTIFTAAQDAALEVVERHPHELEVDYAPPGKDATVAYGSLDLRVKNTKPFAIRFECTRDEDNMTITVKRA